MKLNYVIIRGPLGCGKSTISERLAKKMNGKHIAYDRILDEFNLTEDKEEGYISQKSFFKANEIAFERAEVLIKQGKFVIFDGNFYWKSQLDDLINKLRKYKGKVFTFQAPVEVCIKRDAERNKTHGEIAAKVVHKKSISFSYGEIIDTKDKTSEQTFKEIEKKLAIW